MGVGCVGSMRARVAAGANAALPAIVEAYRQEGETCVRQSTARAEAELCISGVKQRWAKVWSAWDALRTADDAVVAWCKLAELLPALKLGELSGVVCDSRDGGL